MIVAAILAALALATALEAPAVVVSVEDCPAIPRDQLARLLRLELDGPVSLGDASDDRAVRVRATCARNTVDLRVDDATTKQSLRRELGLPSGESDAFVRVLTLVIAEMVLTSRAAPSPEPTATAPAPAPAVQLPSPAIPVARGTSPPPDGPPRGQAHLMAFAQALGPFSGVGVAWGGGLRAGWTFAGRASTIAPVLEGDLAGARTRIDRALGAIEGTLWSATLRASLRLRAGALWFDAGGGGRFGLAQLQGLPADTTTRAGTAAGTWAGPILHASVGARLGHVAVALGLEGGQVLRAVSGLVDQDVPVAIKGRWTCATVAGGWTQ